MLEEPRVYLGSISRLFMKQRDWKTELSCGADRSSLPTSPRWYPMRASQNRFGKHHDNEEQP